MVFGVPWFLGYIYLYSLSAFLALLPDEPANLTIINIMSRNVDISWLKPKNEGHEPVSRFWIKLKKDNALIHNITTTGDVLKYEIKNLVPFTAYEISVAAGNVHGFGEEIVASLKTSEEGESYDG